MTNDDGIDRPGVPILARLAVEAGLEVTVAAPLAGATYGLPSVAVSLVGAAARVARHA